MNAETCEGLQAVAVAINWLGLSMAIGVLAIVSAISNKR